MRKIRKMNVVLAMVLSMTLLFGATISANAASAEVKFDVKQTDTNLAINVPTTVPIIFNEDGTNTYPTNWEIQNVGILGCVCLKNVEMEATDAGWILLDEKEAGESKPIQFEVERGAFSEDISNRTTFNIILKFKYI